MREGGQRPKNRPAARNRPHGEVSNAFAINNSVAKGVATKDAGVPHLRLISGIAASGFSKESR